MANNKEYAAHDEEGMIPLMCHVTAPASLPGGYTFEALVNDDPDRPFTCEVPENGVVEGETFLARLPASVNAPRIKAPTGEWKDGIFSCFSLGICHPHLWCAFCCSKIAMAQIMTRMRLTWLGEPGDRSSTKNTFKVVLLLLASYFVYTTSLEVASLDFTPENMPAVLTILRSVGSALFILWGVYSLCRTRQNVRAQYSIPETHCVGCEDFCCAALCTCCTISQMARHTGEYETYKGVCCTTTGHQPGVPLTV